MSWTSSSELRGEGSPRFSAGSDSRIAFRSGTSGRVQLSRKATKAIGTPSRNIVWMVWAMPSTTPAWTAAGRRWIEPGSSPLRLRSGAAPWQVERPQHVAQEEVGEDRPEHGGPEGAADGAEEGDARGGGPELGVGDGVLDGDGEHLEDQAQAEAEHGHGPGGGPRPGVHADQRHQVEARRS